MDINRGSQPVSAKARRLGKKAIFYGRIATALGVPQSVATKSKGNAKGKKKIRLGKLFARIRAFRPARKHWIMGACAVLLIAAGLVCNSIYQTQRAATAESAAKAANERQVKLDAAAQECYKRKTAEKQKMLGKVTYDQLYDGDSCTATQ